MYGETHLLQMAPIGGIGLVDHFGIPDDKTRKAHGGRGEGHGEPMVAVGVDDGRLLTDWAALAIAGNSVLALDLKDVAQL
jgi:hypothetical protein